jgi:hypothetical protein
MDRNKLAFSTSHFAFFIKSPDARHCLKTVVNTELDMQLSKISSHFSIEPESNDALFCVQYELRFTFRGPCDLKLLSCHLFEVDH